MAKKITAAAKSVSALNGMSMKKDGFESGCRKLKKNEMAYGGCLAHQTKEYREKRHQRSGGVKMAKI